jgi:hypothetical protein
MVDLLNVIFSSFWTFIGTAILLGIVTRGLVSLLAVVIASGRNPNG